ncbi:hypothetical protein LTR87_017943, partial [Friedmanniomyces endolithicus]
ERAFTKRNILAGWSKAGLLPFNPDRVLKDLPMPVDESSKVDQGMIRPSPLETSLPMPVTPVTTVSAEAFMSLHNMIINHDARSLDRSSKQALDRHVQKLAKGAATSFAMGALLQDQVTFLLRFNNEARVRRATASTVLGKGNGKVMSYEDLKEARAKRAEKDATKVGRQRIASTRKRRNPVSAEQQLEVARTGEATDGMRTPVQTSDAQILGLGHTPEPWRPPVARMW